MAVKIRLKRLGKIRVPQYRIVVVDSRKKRDGKVIEEIGKYHPKEEPSFIDVVSERAQYWLGVGAQPTEAVEAILKVTGDWQKFKGEPAPPPLLMAAERTDRKAAYEAEAKAAISGLDGQMFEGRTIQVNVARPREGGVEWPMRRVLQANEALGSAYFSSARLSPQFDRGDITRARKLLGWEPKVPLDQGLTSTIVEATPAPLIGICLPVCSSWAAAAPPPQYTACDGFRRTCSPGNRRNAID